jgi:hypothetical protein
VILQAALPIARLVPSSLVNDDVDRLIKKRREIAATVKQSAALETGESSKKPTTSRS